MKGLQVIEGVPHTHGRRSNRQRPKGLKIDHRRTSLLSHSPFPSPIIAPSPSHCCSFGYYLYSRCLGFDHVCLRHLHHRLSLIRRCFELAVVVVAVIVGISSSSSSILLLTHRPRIVATRAFVSVYAVAAASSFVYGRTGFALDPQ